MHPPFVAERGQKGKGSEYWCNFMPYSSLTPSCLTLNAAPNTPPSASVTVVNTGANPVPVVQQGGVTLNGTPSVNIANSAVSPVPVRAVDSSTAQPVFQSRSVESSANTTPVAFFLYRVPAGKLLVVEHVSARVNVVPGVKILAGFMQDEFADSPFFGGIELLPVFTGTNRPRDPSIPQTDTYLVSQPVKFFVTGGDRFFISFFRDRDDGDATGNASFTGYLVDAP